MVCGRRLLFSVLLVVVACGTLFRVWGAFSVPGFDPRHPEGLFFSDPALLLYITERLVDNGGFPPDDFRKDTRIEHPMPDDIPAMFTVGQEFYLAWGYLFLGKRLVLSLHVYIAIAMAFFAALAAIGVCGLAAELTESRGWAVFACLAYAFTPASYRTLGALLIREDFSLTLFAIHLWLVVRAARVRTHGAFILASAFLLASVATWHAMVFVCGVEMAVLFAWYLRTGENLVAEPGGFWMVVVMVAGAFAVPVLAAKTFILSLPMQFLTVLAIMALLQRFWNTGHLGRVVASILLFALFFTVFSFFYPKDYSHVLEFLASKLAHPCSAFPDPNNLTFGARLLWQGPFVTASPYYFLSRLGALLLLLAVALPGALAGWKRGAGDGRVCFVTSFALFFVVASFFVKRLVAVEAIAAPAVAAALLSRARLSWVRQAAAVAVAVQVSLLVVVTSQRAHKTWYPMEQSIAMKHFVSWARNNLGDGGAIAADFMNSPAILAHTGHPVALQPKYETLASRQRIERFVGTFYHGTPLDLRRLLFEWDCRYLLVDARTMIGMRYLAGLWFREFPRIGTAAAAFLSSDIYGYGYVPGFELLWCDKKINPLFRFYRVK